MILYYLHILIIIFIYYIYVYYHQIIHPIYILYISYTIYYIYHILYHIIYHILLTFKYYLILILQTGHILDFDNQLRQHSIWQKWKQTKYTISSYFLMHYKHIEQLASAPACLVTCSQSSSYLVKHSPYYFLCLYLIIDIFSSLLIRLNQFVASLIESTALFNTLPKFYTFVPNFLLYLSSNALPILSFLLSTLYSPTLPYLSTSYFIYLAKDIFYLFVYCIYFIFGYSFYYYLFAYSYLPL